MNQIVELNQQKRETIEKVTARVQKEINLITLEQIN